MAFLTHQIQLFVRNKNKLNLTTCSPKERGDLTMERQEAWKFILLFDNN